ncbi:2-keto-4-pentenoate hydratase [Promicromonospora sp. AC04]|uniref:2-keto-4-pentenoate hydratase n=1 Tax=Promicromonospora sp. AC04 TaxID=2135723 RepID=UPI000D3AA9BA|nr:fumarylacetoacetate hydrolase family protein [Promicromonospora sp. AC04]PUB27605.1 2-keto-4-pentenoate hydratase [Promicromonospora sp. AC04]
MSRIYRLGLLADRLETAAATRTPIPPLRNDVGAASVSAAYAVQAELTRRRVARGGRVVGRKVGLTSPAVQAQLRVDQPDFGVLFADMQVADGGTVPAGTLLQPKIEAEVAFVLREDLVGELDLAQVRGAVAHAVAALEIVDSRIEDWDIGIVDTVADNGSSALFVLGGAHRTLDEIEPRDVGMSLSVDGRVASTGSGEACLGDPLAALLWLARTAQDHGAPLRAGEVVLSGALGPMVTAVPGTTYFAEITPLGSVSVEFGKEQA